MSVCTAQKGFFLLRECGRPASSVCSQCGRPICNLHMTMRDGGCYCFECAPQSNDTEDGADDASDASDTDFWESDESTHRYRKEYYQDPSHHPVDADKSGAFSEADFAAFDREDGASFDSDDSAKVDFGDS